MSDKHSLKMAEKPKNINNESISSNESDTGDQAPTALTLGSLLDNLRKNENSMEILRNKLR